MEKIPVRHIKEPGISGDGFNIRSEDVLLADAGMVQPLHRHSFYYLLALEKASGEHRIDFTPYPVGDHSVFFMRPGQAHQLTLKRGATGFLLQFTRAFYSPSERTAIGILRRVSNKPQCSFNPTDFKKILAILANIKNEHTTKREHYQSVIRAQLDILFIELLRQSRNPHQTSTPHQEYQLQRLDELQELIDRHLTTHKQVAFYAQKLHLTPYQLNAITRTTLGKTGSQLITDHIILEARRLLLATTNPVNHIAGELGYEDPSYFIRFFRKHTGHSPESYRQNFK